MRFMFGLSTAAVTAIFFLGCGSTEEVSENDLQALAPSPAAATPTPTPSPAVTPTANAVPEAVVTPTPTASPLKTQAPGGDPFDMTTWAVVPIPTDATPGIPDSWNTLTSKGAVGYEFRYPETWFSDNPTRVLSFDPATWTTSAFPTGGIVFEVQIGLIGSSAERPAEATDKSIDGVSGWEIVRVRDLPNGIPSISRVHTIGLDHGEYRVFLVGFFDDRDPDETSFRQIVSSFGLK